MEIEAKFIVPDAAMFARLLECGRLGAYKRGKLQTQEIVDRYVDTPDRRFYREQWAVRLRAGDGNLCLTLKGLAGSAQGAVHTREELEIVVPGRDIASWPRGAVRDLALAIAGEAPLVDLVVLQQTRHVARLRRGKDEVAAWSLDDITIPRPEGPLHAAELEIEALPDGSRADLDAIVAALTETFQLPPQPLSKFERALHLAQTTGMPTTKLGTAPSAARPEAGLRPDDGASTAARKVLQVQVAALLAGERTAREDDPRGVHKMRVAALRIRTALDILEPYSDDPALRRLGRGLGPLRQALGAVRDYDVLLGHVQAFHDSAGPAGAAGLQALLKRWTRERRQARKALRRVLDSHAYDRWKRRLVRFAGAAAPEEARAGGAPVYQVRHLAGSTLWARYAAVRVYETVTEGAEPVQLHALRRAAKSLRYTLEFFREVLPPAAATLVADLVTLQDRLGAMQDADVTRLRICAYLADTATAGGAPAAGVRAYLADRAAASRAVDPAFAAAWAHVLAPAWRVTLATVITAL